MNGTAGFERLIDTEEAAALLGLHPKTIQAFARRGEIPCIRIGKYWKFRISSLDKWTNDHINTVAGR